MITSGWAFRRPRERAKRSPRHRQQLSRLARQWYIAQRVLVSGFPDGLSAIGQYNLTQTRTAEAIKADRALMKCIKELGK